MPYERATLISGRLCPPITVVRRYGEARRQCKSVTGGRRGLGKDVTRDNTGVFSFQLVVPCAKIGTPTIELSHLLMGWRGRYAGLRPAVHPVVRVPGEASTKPREK